MLLLLTIFVISVSLIYRFTPDKSIAHIPSVPIYRTILGMLKRLPFDDMLTYTKQIELLHKFKLARAYFQGHWTVMIGCPDMAAAIYKDTELFPKIIPEMEHPDSVFSRITGHSAFFANGGDWRYQRKTILGPNAFSMYNNLTSEHVSILMSKLDKKINSYQSKKIDTLDLMQRITFDCLTKQFLDKDFELVIGNNSGLLNLFDNAFEYGFTLMTMLFPSLQNAKNPFYSKVYNDIDRWENCLEKVIKATRKRIDIEGPGNSPDIVSRMINSSTAPDDVILSNLKMLFLPSQSLPPALCAALHYLAQNPEIQMKAYVEAMTIVGRSDSALTEQTISELPYLSAIIKETFRLYPTLCPPPKRIASRDTVLGGTHIAKGTHLMIDTFAIQRDPSLWPNPEKFDPGRFLNSSVYNISHSALKSGYLPFGAGSRRCPGANLVNNLMSNILFKIITKYHIRYPLISTQKPSFQFKLKLKAQVVLIPDQMELEYLPRS